MYIAVDEFHYPPSDHTIRSARWYQITVVSSEIHTLAKFQVKKKLDPLTYLLEILWIFLTAEQWTYVHKNKYKLT